MKSTSTDTLGHMELTLQPGDTVSLLVVRDGEEIVELDAEIDADTLLVLTEEVPSS